MGWFFNKKAEKMEIPPPPPPASGRKTGAPLDDIKKEDSHLPSDMPEIRAPEKRGEGNPKMPEFPEIPKEPKQMKKVPPKIMISSEEHIEKPVTKAEVSGPRFVKVSGYQTVLTTADEIRTSLKKAENVITRLSELKNEEEKEFEKWRVQLEDTEKKLNYVDKVIFKGE